jgi:hypothetical protein
LYWQYGFGVKWKKPSFCSAQKSTIDIIYKKKNLDYNPHRTPIVKGWHLSPSLPLLNPLWSLFIHSLLLYWLDQSI